MRPEVTLNISVYNLLTAYVTALLQCLLFTGLGTSLLDMVIAQVHNSRVL